MEFGFEPASVMEFGFYHTHVHTNYGGAGGFSLNLKPSAPAYPLQDFMALYKCCIIIIIIIISRPVVPLIF